MPAAGTIQAPLRLNSYRDVAQGAKELRAERKEVIVGFVDADAQIERYREDVAAGRNQNDGELAELLHGLWRAKKILELVCSGEVAQAAQDYAHALDVGARQSPEARPSERERKLRVAFLEAARREMGYSGDPLIRRMPGEARELDTAGPVPMSHS